MVGVDGCDDLLSDRGLAQPYVHLTEPSNKRHQIHTRKRSSDIPERWPIREFLDGRHVCELEEAENAGAPN